MSKSHYYLPDRLKTDTGETRRVGYELEFAGLEMKVAADVLAQTLNGNIRPDTEAECHVEHPEFGDFKIELDWHFAKTTARDRAEERAREQGKDNPDDPVMEWMTRIASQVVPVEIVCPPIPMDRMASLDAMVSALRDAGALGTEESLLYAFGVHINPEIPDESPETLVRYLQAYCVAQNWLIDAHGVDPVRRVTPYIDLYPGDYVQLVCNYDTPDQDTLIDDYLAHNPTRNRALDLTPLIKHLDAKRLEAQLSDPRINARPTFHYRMPNCEIEQPGWHLARAWNIWGVIEQLAADQAMLADLCQQTHAWHDKLITLETAPWHETLDQLLNAQKSV